MQEELDSLHKNNTWELIVLSPGHVPIANKWVYKIKTKSHGSVDRYKARSDW